MQTVRRLYLYLMSGISLGVLLVGLDILLSVVFHAVGFGRGDLVGGGDTDRQALSLVAGSAIRSALKRHGEQKRLAARATFAESKAAYERRRAELPKTIAEKMKLLTLLLGDGTAAGMRTSLAHRNLSSVPEDELDSLLIQLIELTNKKQ